MKTFSGLNMMRSLIGAVALLAVSVAHAVSLTDFNYSTAPGDVVEIELSFDGTPPEVSGYTIEKPARIALDLPGVQSELGSKRHELGNGNARNATVVEAKDRTRVVISLINLANYTTTTRGNKVYVRIGAAGQAVAAVTPSAGAASSSSAAKVVNLDFRRGDQGEGQVRIALSDSRASADIRREGNKVIAELNEVSLPDVFSRRLDVTDFSTPVQFVDAMTSNGKTRIVIEPVDGEFEYLAYQTDKVLSINVTRPAAGEVAARSKEPLYTGEKLSLNFQDIEVRAVLQLIADFTGLNLVASDSVGGNITLRLDNVPWDQALDLVLKSKGLGKRQMGAVLLVAPAEEIAAREKVELEAVRQVEELAPLVTEYMQLRYAKATDLQKLLSSENGLLSDRGTAVVDERTNTLLMKDTASNLEKVREALTMLDVPVRQVLIEARIVIAETSVGEELGVQWGGASFKNNGDNWTTMGGTKTTLSEGNQILFDRATAGSTDATIDLETSDVVDFGVTDPSATTFAIGYQTVDFLLDLELSAIETEGRGELVSQPRVITSDGKTALIESGEEIPYQQASSSGATNVAFKSAVLKLEVTPQITPDDRIIMDLAVSQDSRGEDTTAGPAINTNAVETQVLVENGETIVLGGIYRREEILTIRKTPFFGDLPLIGALFRYKGQEETKRELLVFITPRLVKDSLTVR